MLYLYLCKHGSNSGEAGFGGRISQQKKLCGNFCDINNTHGYRCACYIQIRNSADRAWSASCYALCRFVHSVGCFPADADCSPARKALSYRCCRAYGILVCGALNEVFLCDRRFCQPTFVVFVLHPDSVHSAAGSVCFPVAWNARKATAFPNGRQLPP